MHVYSDSGGGGGEESQGWAQCGGGEESLNIISDQFNIQDLFLFFSQNDNNDSDAGALWCPS